MSIHNNRSAYKAGKYTVDSPVVSFSNKNKHDAQSFPPTLSNCFIVNIASEKSKRKCCSNPLANTCKRCKWKVAERETFHSQLFPTQGTFFLDQGCFELCNTLPGSLANSSTQSSIVSKWQFKYRNAQSFLTNPTDTTLFDKHCWYYCLCAKTTELSLQCDMENISWKF